ncbi:uncharacterized protein IWZ02DRAFT_447351 [Phyllosticta citriasiana]|uniref:Uncharacterized protein n=1 Tax=Phyllosticta citriasiana TaxID=595635 RepID=A0ABR1KN39_9PEZI
MSSLTSLPLCKYSCTPQQSEPFQWFHISSPGLFVVFDFSQPAHAQHGEFGPARLLKVVQGAELLETVDVVRNVQQADAMLADARNRSHHLRIHELPISAMIRRGTPIVAIKYSLPDGMTRRFQLRFPSEGDFRIAHDILYRAGIQISESPALSKPVCRASSSHSVPNFASSLPPSSPPKVDVWHARQEPRRPASSALSGSQIPTLLERPSFRPSTAPTTDLGRPGYMPPRRELPFPRPSSSSTQSLPGSRSSSKAKTAPTNDTDKQRRNGSLTSSADLPPLMPPRLARPPDRDIASSGTTAFGIGASELESPHQVEQRFQGMNDLNAPQQHRPPSALAATFWKRPSTSAYATSSDRIESDQSAYFDSGALVPQSANDHMSPRMCETSGGDGTLTKSTRAMATSWDADIAGYSSQSVQDREHQLDDLFAHCIHDDDFLLLCQDVASRWHRFYLGSI